MAYTWPDLLSHLKSATGTKNFDNLDDSLYYEALTKAHSQIVEYLKARIDSKFFMGITQANIIWGQTLYDNLWKDDTTWLYINVIDAIFVKYNWESFQKVEIRDLAEMPKSREYYQENQSESNPFAVITGQKILLFPTPKIDVVNGIEIIWSKNVKDISDTTVKEELFNGKIQESNYIDLIIKGARLYIYTEIEEFWKEQKIRQEFIYEDLPNMKTELSFRGSQPIWYIEPNLSYLLI